MVKIHLKRIFDALKCNPVFSSFGGIVAFNKQVDIETAVELNKIFLEIVDAPSFSDGALEVLKEKTEDLFFRKNLC